MHKCSQRFFAVKVIRKSYFGRTEIKHGISPVNELSILRSIQKFHSPNLLKYYDHFEDREACYLVTECADEGSLLSAVLQ